jgi:hypothetical protein
MGNYLSEFPISGAAPRLSAELDGIVFLANAAMEAGVTGIDSLTREKLSFETEKADAPASKTLTPAQQKDAEKKAAAAKAAAAKNKAPAAKAPAGPAIAEGAVIERQPIEITVTGKNRAMLNFLEKLANASPATAPHFFAIRTLRIENESKDGPQKSVTVERKEIQLNPDDKTTVYMQDALYLLGNESVKMHLDLDLLRFSEPPAEAVKTAPGKSADKAAPKPVTPAKPASAPAPSATSTPAPANPGQ